MIYYVYIYKNYGSTGRNVLISSNVLTVLDCSKEYLQKTEVTSIKIILNNRKIAYFKK